jgi:OmpA-OmpF porin, OOP family
MNYSTLKKTAALSLVSMMAVGALKAQTTDSTRRTSTTTRMSDSTMTSSTMTNARTFGGQRQFNTFSIGVNAGITSPAFATGGSFNDFAGKTIKVGYGASLRWQLTPMWGIEGDFHGGWVGGNNNSAPGGYRVYPDNTPAVGAYAYKTLFYSGTISAVANVLDLDFLHRQKGINIFATAGGGLVWYHPVVNTTAPGSSAYTYQETNGDNHYVKSLLIPVGIGAKFRLTDAVQFVLGYTENFTDDDNLDGVKANYPTRDHYSYGYGGFEFTLGPKSKRNLDWVNPVAMMYDELYDAALRQEVEALRGRVTNVENAVNDLKKDSDGDGVSDQFDKCPNTPAGTVVDGAGCPIKFPQVDSASTTKPIGTAYANIQFDFDSSVLRTSSYPVLDATSADLRSGSGKMVELDGYASSEGTAAHNMKLSKDRAESVKTYLVNSGVEARRLKVKAYGETHPIADNSTEEGRVQNRRVEFKQK